MSHAPPAVSRTLTWKGGFWLALVIPMSGLTLAGIVIGFTHPALIGYGGTEQLIALSVIVVGLLSFFFTRYVQLGLRGRRLWLDAGAGAVPVAAESSA